MALTVARVILGFPILSISAHALLVNAFLIAGRASTVAVLVAG